MEAIKSCDENEVVMIPNEPPSDETKEYFVPTRVSSRLQDRPKMPYDIYNKFGNNFVQAQYADKKVENETNKRASSRLQKRTKILYDIYNKRGMNFEDHFVKKRTKPNPLMQHKALATKIDESDPWCHSIGSKVNGGNNESSSTNSVLLVFDELDFRGILNLRETFRLANLRNLAKEEEQNQNKNPRKNNKTIATLLGASNEVKNGNDDEGVPGLTTSRYLMNKLQELAKVGMDKVNFMKGQVSRAISSSPSLVCTDISIGQEPISIIATNEFDDPPVAPTGFQYITANQIASTIKVPSSGPGCNCIGSCRDTITCGCAKLNGQKFPYACGNGGRLIEPRDIVYECGPICGCGPNCGNKVSQKALIYRLEVFRTPNKGWGVRTWDFIPSGAPVVEYIGVLSRDDELDNAIGNEYIFDIDCLHTIKGEGGRERRSSKKKSARESFSENIDEELENDPEFCIDASSFGNVSRFINHGCVPNLFVQGILSSHRDIRLARVVLFAAQDIPPYQELTYDYGYKLDSVVDPDGKIKQLECHCGANECRKRLY